MPSITDVLSLFRPNDLYAQHVADLARSGISKEQALAAGFRSIVDAGLATRLLCWNKLRKDNAPTMVILFRHPAGTLIEDYCRLKLDKPRKDNEGKPIKYESPRGKSNHAYFPLPTCDKLETALPILITEGEKKALKAALEGFAAIGLVGIWGWQRKRERDTNGRGKGDRKLLPELDCLPWRDRRIIIAFDSDAVRKPEIQLAESCLAESLLKKGAGEIKIVRLPDLPNGDKCGLDDFLVAHSAVELQALIDSAAVFSPPGKEKQQRREQHKAMLTQSAAAKKEWEDLADPHYLAREFLDTFKHESRPGIAFFREKFWTWETTHWHELPDAEIDARSNRFAKRKIDEIYALLYSGPPADEKERPKAPKITAALVANIRQALAGNVLIPVDTPMPSWIGAPADARQDLIALDNGLLDVAALFRGDAKCLLLHTPDWFSPIRFSYPFDPKADCLKWRAFLTRNLEGEQSPKARLLQQWFGYCILPDVTRQRFLLMLGEGANGKSVVCAVLRALLGEDNCASVPLEMFGSRFSLDTTVGKLANIAAEVGELDKVAEGQLKAFTAGDLMQFEKKNKTPYMAKPTARLILSTNNAPEFRDKSDGLWRRMLALHLAVQIPEAERVAGMDTPQWWIDAGEVPGILNWALAGLHHLRKAGTFTVPSECQDVTDRLRGEANPAKRFLDEHYQAGSGEIEKQTAYNHYRQWCEQNGHHALSSNKFAGEVYRRFRGLVKEGKPQRDGRRIRVFEGLQPISEL